MPGRILRAELAVLRAKKKARNLERADPAFSFMRPDRDVIEVLKTDTSCSDRTGDLLSSWTTKSLFRMVNGLSFLDSQLNPSYAGKAFLCNLSAERV